MKKHTPHSLTAFCGRFPLTAVLLTCAAGPLAAQTIPNPSFEADTFTVPPGYVSGNPQGITGWTGSPNASYGLNPSPSSPFADNGAVPNGTKVAFIQSQNSGIPTELGTTISGLTINSRYRLSFRANARGGQNPLLTVSVGGVQLLQSIIFNVAGANPYRYVDLVFTADSASMPLVLQNVAAGDTTVVVDDFSVTAAANVTWSNEPWSDDATIGLDSAYAYTHAYNLNSTAGPTVNGVIFVGINGANPAVPNSFSMMGYNATFVGDNAEGTITGDGAAIASDFVYNGIPGALALQGLKPNTKHVLSLYSVGFDSNNFTRWITFGLGNDRLSVDQNAFGNDNGNRVILNYTSNADGKATIDLMPLNNASFHLYGFSNREAALPPAAEAPQITIQPTGAQILVGGTYTMVGGASGIPAPAYQWYLNGTVLTDNGTFTGSQTAGLTITPGGAAEAGFYTVQAKNSQGSSTSKGAYLEVLEPKAGPLYSTGVDATGTPLDPTDIDGNPSTDPHYTLKVNPGGAIDIPAIVQTGLPGPWIANTAASQWIGPQANTATGAVGVYTYRTTIDAGANADTFAISGYYAVDNFTNAIQINGQPVTGVTLSQNYAGSTWFSISKANAPSLRAGANDLDFIVENGAPAGPTGLHLLSVGAPAGIKPAVLEQPAGGTIVSGQPVTLSARAYGSGPLAYQWSLNGSPITGATLSSYTIGSFTSAQAGTYAVKVTNPLDSATSENAVLAITDVPPSIVTHPATQLAAVGEPLTLTVSANGSAPFTYQWLKDGNPINLATNATYTIGSAALTDSGSYSVKVTNGFGDAISNTAVVTVMTRVPGTFDTGVDDTRAVLAEGENDPHYTLLFNPDGQNDIPAVVQGSLPGAWLANSSLSKWIGPQLNTISSAGTLVDSGAGPGTYVYRTTFNLTGFDPASVIISGMWTSDNGTLAIRINDNPTGLTSNGPFALLEPFRIDDGNADFVSGENTLDFVVQNAGDVVGYTGLRVQGMNVLGTAVSGTNLPPVTITLSATGKPVISFPGTPGITYPIQRSTTLTPANSWAVIGQPIAPANGQVQFEDQNPPAGRAFYRAVIPQ